MRRGLYLILAAVSLVLGGCGAILDDLREESRDVAREEHRVEAFERSASAAYRGPSANNVSSYYGGERRRLAPAGDRYRRGADEWGERAGEYGERAQRYARENMPKRRYTRQDFVDDNTNENSLWNGQGQTNYFFTQNKRFDPGDLVVVGIERGLRREIQYALWKSLPAHMRRIRRKKPEKENEESDAVRSTASAQQQAAESAEEEAAAGSSLGKKYENDLIRMEVIENLGNGLVRMVGQKRVIYRGRPKFVEVAALMRARHIDKQAKASSSNFLDIRTRVLQ